MFRKPLVLLGPNCHTVGTVTTRSYGASGTISRRPTKIKEW